MRKCMVSRNFGMIFLIYMLCGCYFLFQFEPSFSFQEKELFFVLIISYFCIAGLLVYAKARYDLYVFEPLFFISLLYIGVFICKPIIDLKNGAMIEHGINVIDGGVKATLILLVSYSMLFYSYYKGHCHIVVRNIGRYERKNFVYDDKSIEEETCDVTVLVISWGIVFLLCLVCMFSQGLSISYIFSLGTSGERVVDESNTALLFLSNFGVTSVTLWLMIITRSRSASIKIILTILEIFYLLIRNGRWLILVIGLAPVVYFYTKHKKSPKASTMMILSLAFLIIFAWMQVNRTAIRTGGGYSGWGEKGLTLEILLSPFESDLNTYRLFYSMVTRFPTDHSYMLGITFAYTIILFVPRVIWNGKPDNPVRTMTEYSLNSEAKQAGTAVANLGEFYANFGIVGCLIGMYLVGWGAQELKKWFTYPTEDRLVMYAIMYPLMFQWVARGNFSGNFYMTIFALSPFIVKNIVKHMSLGR